jgi:hypothetical protein
MTKDWNNIDIVNYLRDNHPNVKSGNKLYKEDRDLYYHLLRIGKLNEFFPTREEALEKVVRRIIGCNDAKEEKKMEESTRQFFSRDVQSVAKELAGCKIEYDGIEAIITKATPYEGISKSAHKKENFKQEQGFVWVNNRYGHLMLNINAYESMPSVVVLTGIELGRRQISGPGNVTESLGIDETVTGTFIGDKIKIYLPK